MKMMHEITTLGTTAAIAGILAIGVPDAESLKAVSSFPIEVILGIVAGWLAWLNYKVSIKFADKTAEIIEKQGKRWDSAIDGINTLAKEIHGRPCLRYEDGLIPDRMNT